MLPARRQALFIRHRRNLFACRPAAAFPGRFVAGMNFHASGQTGSEEVKHTEEFEIAIGAVSYAVRRVYQGSHSAAELVLEQITKRPPEASFDGAREDVVSCKPWVGSPEGGSI